MLVPPKLRPKAIGSPLSLDGEARHGKKYSWLCCKFNERVHSLAELFSRLP